MDSKTEEPLVVGRQLEAGGEYEDDERVVFRARFDDRYVRYQLVSFSLVCVLTVFFIPFLLLLPFLYIAIRANFQSRELIVTEKTLVYKQGFFGCCCICWNESSKHVPLEKVTDLTYSQGCLARQYGLATLQIQTAGQNGPDGRPELTITGISDARNFRKVVMSAKSNCMEATFGGYGSTVPAVAVKDGAKVASDEVMVNMRDTLLRMESTLKRIDQSLASKEAATPPTAE